MTLGSPKEFASAGAMKTFCIQTLGCKVNQYESEQVIALLRSRGLVETAPQHAELRIINSCSVTVQAASQSRQSSRRMVKLPILPDAGSDSVKGKLEGHKSTEEPKEALRPRVLVMGCWATSDKASAQSLPGVDAVLTHHDNVATELDRLLTTWSKPTSNENVKEILKSPPRRTSAPSLGNGRGANSLPLLGDHQSGRQRAFLKVQDGCDAHCTYCIIPSLRPRLFSKPIDEAVEEATRLIASGHVEIVLTGIFLGAYGQPTALRRRQPAGTAPLADLICALCTRVSGLQRLRLSSLEPGDLTDELLKELASHEQVVPHFHLPLQSGSDEILRRMNRQYRRDDFLQMVERVHAAFDRPALTTDIIAGFPGETDHDFEETVEIVNRSRFIHVHAFPFSPRPGTAAARWETQFVRGPVVNQRIDYLNHLADRHSFDFRSQFVGEMVKAIVERWDTSTADTGLRQGRTERYFAVHFDAPLAKPGDRLDVRIDRVTPSRTFGTISQPEST
jgi:threonylcarbamoyladenosine tRNA methylthiotransferase MtaB